MPPTAPPTQRHPRSPWTPITALALLLSTSPHVSAADPLPPSANRVIDFKKDIQPILSASCHSCHGPTRAENGLRLDQRTHATQGGDRGPAILPGKSSESLLIQAVAWAHPELRMPKKGDRLSPDQVGILRAWIDQGATWPEPDPLASAKDPAKHWAFQPPTRPNLPPNDSSDWPRNPIDRFVLAKLQTERLKPSPAADRVTLLRRLHLDLIGLPPTPAEVDAFLADRSHDALEKQLERLLKSPHYGERWARHWLDAARYADSDGFEKDKARFIWFYRDWVVEAFNRNLPYDRFVIEQLAGDLLPNPTQDQIVATGFLRNSMVNEEGGVDPEQFRMDAMFDRMDCIGKTVLAVTIQCAQCHNHKFDPISQEEYYRLFAFLNNDHEGTRTVHTAPQLQSIAALRRQIDEIESDLQHRTPDWPQRMAAWEESVKTNQPNWIVLSITNAGDGSQRYAYLPDQSLLAGGYAPTKWTSHFVGTNTTLPNVAAFRLEYFTHPDLPSGGPGRSIHGMAALTEFKVEAVDAANPTNKQTLKFVRATADFANPEKPLEPEFDDRSGKTRVYGPVEFAIDGKDDTAWGIDAGPGRRNQDRKAVFVATEPVGFPAGTAFHFRLQQNHGGWNSDDNQNHNLGRFRISIAETTNALADPLPRRVRQILDIPAPQRSPSQTAAVFSYWRATVAEWKNASDKIEALLGQWPEGHTTLALEPRAEPRTTAILRRGDWLKPSKPVLAGTPAILHPLPTNAASDRLTFARWLVDRRSPTTARAFVNRVWQAYFGTGLVETAEDFGLQSPPPSHPELLDWLACEFMDSGWNIQHLHRLITASATYRQSSRVSPQLLEKDPYNRLLARGARFRVEGEIVRDIALAAGNMLNPSIGGPPVFSPAPPFLFQPPASYGPFNWIEETGTNRYRRALYTFRRRSTPYPPLQNFDVPNGDFSCVRRSRSNTPLQALTTLNETLFIEAAQNLAHTTLRHGGRTDGERIAYAFRRVLSRQPTPSEAAELKRFLDRQRQRIADGWVNPIELGTGKPSLPADAATGLPPQTNPTQLAAFTLVSRILLNLDETITRE